MPEKINLDDGHAIKHKLDATASEVCVWSILGLLLHSVAELVAIESV